MKNRVRMSWKVVLFLAYAFFSSVSVKAASGENIYNSPYVSFSPDGKAWTTNAGDTDYTWYEEGTRVITGISSTIRSLETGEHYYKVTRRGTVPIGYWQVEHRRASCIHEGYPENGYWHGIHYGTEKCERYYYSGWIPYCADCGDRIAHINHYMSRAAAESIDELEVGTGMAYYYLCPHCSNLEQGSVVPYHRCNDISWNRYQVQYRANSDGEAYGGYMEDSTHYYNNATVYEGRTVTPISHLTKNTYIRIGYEFVEWNTEPDGSGISYEDGARIQNLVTGNNEKVVLYAQWRPSRCSLQIDPAGGTYHGNKETVLVTQDYNSIYTIDSTEVKAPLGYRVSFDVGEGQAVSPVTGTQHFTEWKQGQSFGGVLKNNTYFFTAPDGNLDTISAVYAFDPVILPDVYREGSSFGGWYYDKEFEQPAGGPGDSIIPNEDITLYGQWVELRLFAEDNYGANGGKGAVDLSWTQPDHKNKAYMVYQSTDAQNWKHIMDAEDIGKVKNVNEEFTFSEETKQYQVPYTGLYTLTAAGAEGSGFGGYAGGAGGKVSGRFWLQKGEIITYTIGGQNGFHGGGAATMYGNGGGCTEVTSDRLGTLLIAGGGGGASPDGEGGAGGATAGVLTTGIDGESGGAGGGGGYLGGRAGEYIRHYHTPLPEGVSQNSCYAKVAGYNLASRSFYSRVYADGTYADKKSKMGISCHSTDEDTYTHIELGSLGQVLPTENASSATIRITADGWGHLGGSTAYRDLSLAVYNQRGTLLYYKRNFTGTGATGGGSSVGGSYCDVTVTVNWDPGITTGIYIISHLDWDASNAWINHQIASVQFGGTIKAICPYQEGQVVSSKPSYGGSNFVNTLYTDHYDSSIGSQRGNGSFTVESEKIGYVETMEWKGITATDLAPPGPILLSTVKKEPAGKNQVKVSWVAPEDNGTDYYHMVESYLNGSEHALCHSNVTKNTLVSGICGYFWRLDEKVDGTVGVQDNRLSADNGGEGEITITLSEKVQYLHIAPIDVAGNMGNSIHIRLGNLENAEDVLWKLFTEPLEIEEADNVFPAPQDKTYYVRCDGETEFTLRYGSYLDGAATVNYQPNHVVFESSVEGILSKNIFFVASGVPDDVETPVSSEKISYAALNAPLLMRGSCTEIIRKDKNRILSAKQEFTMAPEASGKTVVITPVAGADYLGETCYSEYEKDKKNALTLIGDNDAPVIAGLDSLEDGGLIDRRVDGICLQITAYDELSGLADFWLTIHNEDNHVKKIYVPQADGSINVEITENEPLFSGDLVITVYASDRVGNEREETFHLTEFALETSVERILTPKDPIFKCGESGILTITTWGYADRVEVIFPEEMVVCNPGLNQSYTYEITPKYQQQEKLQFMIPLNTPVNTSYAITVRAYKDDKQLERYPDISVIEVGGSVLDEIRTRLR